MAGASCSRRGGYATVQAATWIVTDNAGYDSLGSLVASRNGIPQGRTIRETEAAQAIRLCAEAGIGIKKKRIWNDRRKILAGLEEGALKDWLESYMKP